MRLVHCLVLALAAPLFVSGVEPKAVDDIIRLPLVQPDNAPKPPPGAVTKLSGDQWYVVDSDMECQVLASPEGIVNITVETGPLKMRGKFVENVSGRVTTRTVKGPFVYVVEAAETGRAETRRVELLIIPAKGKVLRRTLDVETGVSPIPPVPGPPTPLPDGKLGLIKVSRDGLALVKEPTKLNTAKLVASGTRGLASAVAAGGTVDPSLSTANAKKVLDEWALTVKAGLSQGKSDEADWMNWSTPIGKAFFTVYSSGKLKTKADWVAALNEIADGLAP